MDEATRAPSPREQFDELRRVPRRENGGASAPPTAPDAYERYLAAYHGATPPLTREQWSGLSEAEIDRKIEHYRAQINAVPQIDTSSAAYFCSKAARLVGGDRATTHGDKSLNFRNIAELWNGYWRIKCRLANERLSTPFDAHDVGCMMELMKIARRFSGEFNADDYIDAAGYAGCTGEIAAREHTPTTND